MKNIFRIYTRKNKTKMCVGSQHLKFSLIVQTVLLLLLLLLLLLNAYSAGQRGPAIANDATVMVVMIGLNGRLSRC